MFFSLAPLDLFIILRINNILSLKFEDFVEGSDFMKEDAITMEYKKKLKLSPLSIFTGSLTILYVK